MKKLLALFLLSIPSLAFGQGGFNPIGTTKIVFTGASSSTTNTMTMTSAASGAYNIVWPATAGTNTYVLTTDGSGNLSWTNPAATSISSISFGTTGLTPSSATTGPVTVAGTLVLANGGTGASLTASNGGIFYSTGSAGAILSGTATANQVLLSGSSTAPAWSTATYPATTTINQILYSSAANTIGGITTANNEMLGTNGSGVPSFVTAIPSAVTDGSSLTKVGTVTTGTWNAAIITPTYGGTGLGTLTAHNVLLGEGTANVAFAAPSTSGYVLTSSGASSDPTFQALPSPPVSSVSNTDGTLTISPTTGAVVASLALGHANTWTGAQTFNANTTIGSGAILAEQTVTTLVSNMNNLTLPTKTYAYIAASTPGFYITGIAAGVDGQMLLLVNPGAYNVVLKEQNSSSSSGNRFLFSNTVGGTNDCILAPQGAIWLVYDNTNAFNSITGWWRFVAHN